MWFVSMATVAGFCFGEPLEFWSDEKKYMKCVTVYKQIRHNALEHFSKFETMYMYL